MEELTSTENKISFARQAFNDSATQYNIKAESFPTNIIAGMFNFSRATLPVRRRGYSERPEGLVRLIGRT